MTSTPRPHHLPQHSVRACAEFVGASVAATAAATTEALDTAVTGISHDAQGIRPGDLYLAWPGAARHGAEFAPGAVELGAVAVVTDAAGAALLDGSAVPVLVAEDVRGLAGRLSAFVYGEPATRLAMYGVTGTNGKTTTSYLLDGGLRRAGLKTGVIGTVQILIGDEVVPSVRTTPEAPDLQAILATAVEKAVDAVAMEVSSHALAYGRTAGIRFKAAAFLNLTQDHLDFHADFEDYFEAKAKLFTPGYTERAVVDIDDEHGRRIAERCRAAGVEVHDLLHQGRRRRRRLDRRGHRAGRRRLGVHRRRPRRPPAQGLRRTARRLQRRQRAGRDRAAGGHRDRSGDRHRRGRRRARASRAAWSGSRCPASSSSRSSTTPTPPTRS